MIQIKDPRGAAAAAHPAVRSCCCSTPAVFTVIVTSKVGVPRSVDVLMCELRLSSGPWLRARGHFVAFGSVVQHHRLRQRQGLAPVLREHVGSRQRVLVERVASDPTCLASFELH